jgi:putative DNA primase/helicase
MPNVVDIAGFAERARAVTTASTLTEAGAAERFARERKDQLAYDWRRARWMVFHGHHWTPDSSGQVTRMALESVREWQHEAVELTDANVKAAVMQWAVGFERRAKLDAMLAIARCLAPFADDGEHWDANPWLLGTPTGVLNLRTVPDFRDGRPEDKITAATAVGYDPDARCPRWEQFIHEVFVDPDVADYFWRSLGYSLTGDMREQCFWVNHGRGRNGKSTAIDTVSYVLGDYAHPTPFAAFEVQQGNAVPADVAALDGKRFVTASETNGKWLHAPRLKDITGGERITVRHLYGHPFTFRPTCKIWLSVNELPRVGDDSDGLWRRLKQVPFTQRFEGGADDRGLKDTLRAEAPGILAWMVRGCRAWQQRGLDAPTVIDDVTAAYRRDCDQLGQFLDEACELVPGAEVGATDLYRHYHAWAERCGMNEREQLTANNFGRKCSERLRRVRTKAGAVYCDVARRDW